MKTLFKIFCEPFAEDLEKELNIWANSLPDGSRIKSTQLSECEDSISALISYKLPDEAKT
jgi:hypothetical protein